MISRPRERARLGAIPAAVVAVFLFGTASVVAHAELVRSDPIQAGVVADGRTSITLWFTDPISADAGTFDLHTLDGVDVPVTVSVSGSGEGGFVEIGMAPMSRGTYLLDWSVLSVEDGHATRGSLTFGVGVRPSVAATSGGELGQAQSVVLRWLDLSAMMLALGAVIVASLVLPASGALGPSAIRRARRIGALAAGGAIITGAITPFAIIPGDELGAWLGSVWSALIGTQWGRIWMGREALLVIVAVALWSARLAEPAVRRVRVAGLALAGAVLLEAWAGHASALPRDVAPAVLASAAHLVAAGVWVGGLAVMAACLLPAMRAETDARRSLVGPAWRAFSPVAAVATVALAATGVYAAGRHVPDPGALPSTMYGDAVIAKSILMVGALAVAALSTMIVNPRIAAVVGRTLRRPVGWLPLRPDRLRIAVVAELIVLVFAIGAAAVLTSVPTGREVAAAAIRSGPQAATVGGLYVTFESVSAGDDATRLLVRARSVIKPAPGPIESVGVRLVGPAGQAISVDLADAGTGRYEADVAELAPGAWLVDVAVHRTAAADAVARVSWNVRSPAPDGPGPFEQVMSTLAIAILLALAAVVALARTRRRMGERSRRVSVSAGSGSATDRASPRPGM